VIDNKTGLEWEVLCDRNPPDSTCPEDHDVDTVYTWANSFTKITAMNAANYAGHDDWRLPNVEELRTLVDYGAFNPAVDTAMFNTCDTPPCGPDTCTCTAAESVASGSYWTSTTLGQSGGIQTWIAFHVEFVAGHQASVPKTGESHVRAVRGDQ